MAKKLVRVIYVYDIIEAESEPKPSRAKTVRTQLPSIEEMEEPIIIDDVPLNGKHQRHHMSIKTCPHCGKGCKNLGNHIRYVHTVAGRKMMTEKIKNMAKKRR
jgi:hypothetical protein